APAKAEAILTHVSSKRKREEISLNIEGRARNYELILEDTFQITSPKGYVWMPATTFTVVRETFYNPYDYLVSQDWRQYDEMQDEVVVRLLRRMAACKAPKPE
ncbi:MAG: hypothetical protein HUK26_07795, partial [Duodenibacillus sp.]|nr:hypothetical protein [Duodenibacillus sp.]